MTPYADDMLLCRISNSSQDFSYVQQGIDNIGQWVTENNFKLMTLIYKLVLELIWKEKISGLMWDWSRDLVMKCVLYFFTYTRS